ncbi:MAG TPA: glycoside hydrolase family 88 protein [Chitinivibrionales bacterium]|nr:glycoside hydrolase family 88 protein [Chitinivibrionales bacterium]
MKRFVSAISLLIVLIMSNSVFADEFSLDSIKSIMRKVANYTFTTWGGGTAAGINHDWDGGTIMTGVVGLYRTTGEQQWLDSIDKWGNRWNWTWGGGTGDNLCCIQGFCERYIVDSVPANASKYAVSKTALDGILKSPVNHLFGWQDAVYMGLPDFSMMGYITGIPMYYDSLNVMFRGAEKDFQDTVYKLWYWNTSASFKTTPQGHPQFWGPGNAWVLGGMVRALKYMPQGSKYRPAWEATFKMFCDTIRSKQQPDGFWRTSLFEPTEFPNPESSCTAFFIYAMSLGVQWGLLDANTFVPTIRKGWSSLVKVVTPAGMVGYGQPWSNQPGSPEAWTSIPEGHGAFLLAGEGVSIIVSMATAINGITAMKTPGAQGSGTLVALSETRKCITLPAGASGFEMYNVNGARIWKSERCVGKVQFLPSSVAKGGVCFIKFLR